jgi:hypothetical protein
MSLYFVQKVLYELNRDDALRKRFAQAPATVLDAFELTYEERGALLNADIGLLYILGVNGQILMHFAAANGIPWDDYLQRMRDGLDAYGQVRAGVYATTGYHGIDAHEAELAERRGAAG